MFKISLKNLGDVIEGIRTIFEKLGDKTIFISDFEINFHQPVIDKNGEFCRSAKVAGKKRLLQVSLSWTFGNRKVRVGHKDLLCLWNYLSNIKSDEGN